MNREADHTIKGFLYQFNKTLNVILKSEYYDEIKVEGIIEDIDIKTLDGTSAIQCKYHESKDKFSLSDIYKPILQMLCHCVENKGSNIRYILYSHFPNEPVGGTIITITQIKEILSTSNLDYISKYVSKIKPPKDKDIEDLIKKSRKTQEEKTKIKKYYESADLDLVISLEDFLSNQFSFEIGVSYKELTEEIKLLLVNEGFTTEDVSSLFYPNAIQHIAELSINPDPNERTIDKKTLISNLQEKKKASITRWTRELLSYKKILKRRRGQLQDSLNINSRLRYFIIDPESIENFDEEFILFVKLYLDKYNSKIKLHTETPVFIIKTDRKKINDYQQRLYAKDLNIITGFIGDTFYLKEFVRNPKRHYKDNWVEFKAKLFFLSEEVIKMINNHKCDDLFIIGELDIAQIDTVDINFERIDVKEMRELKYLLSLIKEV